MAATALAPERPERSAGLAGLVGLVLALGASQVLGSLLNLARAKSVAVLLGPAGIGIVSVVDQLGQVAVFTASLALPHAGVKYLSRAHSESRPALVGRYHLFTQTVLATSVGLASLAALVTVTWPGVWGEDLAPHAGLIALALVAAPLTALFYLQVNVFAALQRPRLASLALLAGAGMTAVGAVAGLLAAGLPGLYAGHLAASALVVVAILGYLARRCGLPVPPGAWPAWGEWRRHPDVLRFCGMTYLVSVGEPAALLAVRYALLQDGDLTQLGLFQSAYALASYLGLLLLQSNGFYLTPLLNRHAPADEKIGRALEFQRHLALCATAVAVPLALFPEPAIALLFSSAFAAAAAYLALFVASQVMLVLGRVFQALLIGLDDVRTFLLVNVGAQVALAALAWLLAPALGLWGVALAALVAHAGVFVAFLARLMTRHGARLPTRSAAVVGYGLALLAGAGWLGREPITSHETVAARLLFCLAATASLALFLTREERGALLVASSRLWRPGRA